jgi:acyl-CoA reductase-like NAD-dependent aldehyde dehydrogenase
MEHEQLGTSAAELGEYGLLIDGAEHRTGQVQAVRSPYDDHLVALAHLAGPAEMEAAITAAVRSFPVTRRLTGWQRADILNKIAAGLEQRREEFARTIALEVGKPIRTARQEVDRAIFVFRIASEETKRQYGEIVPLDWLPGLEGRTAQVHRVPLGPVTAITPYNFPLNLVAHKVAPALAVGAPIIVRPPPQTPISALKLGELVLEAGWPAAGVAVVPSRPAEAAPLVEDERLRVFTFTGSPGVGWRLKARAGRKRVTLELGGNAGVIVHQDADVAYAAERVAWGAFSYAGQSCISVQRAYLHAEIEASFVEQFLPRVQALKVGDPLDEATDVGPLIDRRAAEQLETRVREARQQGARVLIGGARTGNLWQPTVLTNVQPTMRVACEEVFGPLVGLFSYTDVQAALRAVDDGPFGLQAGLFTNDLRLVHAAFDSLEVGGLMINDVSTLRVDHMPYGGVKQSGEGREGVRYAMEGMTDLKLLTFNRRS